MTYYKIYAQWDINNFDEDNEPHQVLTMSEDSLCGQPIEEAYPIGKRIYLPHCGSYSWCTVTSVEIDNG